MGQQGWLPNAFSWFTVGLLPMFFYKPGGLAFVCSLWGSLTYAIPKVILPAEEVRERGHNTHRKRGSLLSCAHGMGASLL